MINTNFECYCENCIEISPIAKQSTAETLSGEKIVESIIECEHKDRCKAICEHLKGVN